MAPIHDGSTVEQLRAHLASIETTLTPASGPALAHVIEWLRAEIERKSSVTATPITPDDLQRACWACGRAAVAIVDIRAGRRYVASRPVCADHATVALVGEFDRLTRAAAAIDKAAP